MQIKVKKEILQNQHNCISTRNTSRKVSMMQYCYMWRIRAKELSTRWSEAQGLLLEEVERRDCYLKKWNGGTVTWRSSLEELLLEQLHLGTVTWRSSLYRLLAWRTSFRIVTWRSNLERLFMCRKLCGSS